MRRIALVPILLLAVLSGCGSSGESSGDTPDLEAEETAAVVEEPETTEATPPPEELGGSLRYVGTMTGKGEGTGFKDTFRLGPLLHGEEGAPPQEVLDPCLVSGSTAIASSVFARGELTVAYTEGTLPESLSAWMELVQTGGEMATLVSMEIDGEWRCAIEELDTYSLGFQPGETRTFPFWIVDPGVLSNAQPRLPSSVTDHWYFNFVGRRGNQTDVWVNGPGSGHCVEEGIWQLFLYNRSGEGC